MLFVPLGGWVLAIFVSNVIPSSVGTALGLLGGVLCALGWLAFTQSARKAGLYPGVRRIRGLQVLFSCVGLFAGYSTCAWSVPWLVNAAIGTKSEQTVVIEGFVWGGRKSCSHPDIGRGPFILGPRALCVSKDASSVMKPGARLKIVGPATFLGMNAQEIFVLGGPQ